MEKELEFAEIVDVDEPLADRDSHDICEGHLNTKCLEGSSWLVDEVGIH